LIENGQMGPRRVPDESESPSVLQVVTRLNIGGPARHILALAANSRMPMTVVAGRPPAPEGELSDPRVEVTHVPLVRPLSAIQDPRAYRAIRRILLERRPDVLHTHMAKAGAIGRSAAASLRGRPRMVHTFHGHVLAGYFNARAERVFLEVERRLARRTDLLVAVSDEIRDELLERGVGRPEQWRVIPLGFDLRPFLAAKPARVVRGPLGLADDAPLVGMVGRLTSIKDHQTALLAIRDVPDCHLVVVGDGELRGSLERLSADLGLGDRVHFVGWRTDVAAVYADLDVALLTSLNEGTPVSLIEAAAAGVPSVATHVGGVPFVVDDGRTGLLVPPRDPEAVAAGLRRLLSDRGDRKQLGEAARSRVGERFSLGASLDAHRSIYAELSAGPPHDGRQPRRYR
jgi:glycosyltransferase involved in cell wall biosynthesis